MAEENKKVKIYRFKLTHIFPEDGMETFCRRIYGVLSLNFHLTGILEAVVLIKFQLAEIMHLKACSVA